MDTLINPEILLSLENSKITDLQITSTNTSVRILFIHFFNVVIKQTNKQTKPTKQAKP